MELNVFGSALALVVLFIVCRLIRGNVQIKSGYAADDRWMYMWITRLWRKK
ncbi:MAG: hypothetical protein RIB58_12110 [Phycisphaerales bacterium]